VELLFCLDRVRAERREAGADWHVPIRLGARRGCFSEWPIRVITVLRSHQEKVACLVFHRVFRGCFPSRGRFLLADEASLS
jgi:hypothetical protein